MYFIESVSLLQGCPFRGVPLYMYKYVVFTGVHICLVLHRVKETPLEDASVRWAVRSVTLTVEIVTDPFILWFVVKLLYHNKY